MDLIKRLFGGSGKPDLGSPSQIDARPENNVVESDSQATKRRELVRVVTRDTLRAAGIPESWIETQILLELSRGGQPFIHLRLVLRHWDEQLLKYTVAFQRKLMQEIGLYEPNVREWLLSITWQYDVEDRCPYLELPDAETWTNPPIAPPRAAAPVLAPPPAQATPHPAPPPAPPPRDELQEDLAQLYAVRDANLAASAPQGEAQAGNAVEQRKPTHIIPDVII